MDQAILLNDVLRVVILPRCGGKIASLLDRRTGEELLLPASAPYLETPHTAAFHDADLGGFDECLPGVAATPAAHSRPAVPDHGEVWRLPWDIETASPHMLRLSARAAVSGLRLIRSAHLHGARLHLHYELVNESAHTRDWLWAAHPLLLVEPGDRIHLPPGIANLHIEYSCTGAWSAGTSISWPIAQDNHGALHDLSLVREPDHTTAMKLFTAIEDGWCAFERSRLQRVIRFRFDPKQLPCLGLWICRGAWPANRTPRQSTVALEPTTASTDFLSVAARSKYRRRLAPGHSTSWTLDLQVFSLVDFRQQHSR